MIFNARSRASGNALVLLLLVVVAIVVAVFIFAPDRIPTEIRPEVTKPRLPINVSAREAVGPGKVAQFTNESDKVLVVNLVFQNYEKHERKQGSLKIEPGKTEEFGWMEGWVFVPGETITISHPDYREITYTVH